MNYTFLTSLSESEAINRMYRMPADKPVQDMYCMIATQILYTCSLDHSWRPTATRTARHRYCCRSRRRKAPVLFDYFLRGGSPLRGGGQSGYMIARDLWVGAYIGAEQQSSTDWLNDNAILDRHAARMTKLHTDSTHQRQIPSCLYPKASRRTAAPQQSTTLKSPILCYLHCLDVQQTWHTDQLIINPPWQKVCGNKALNA